MMMEWIEKAIKPMLESEYKKGYDAGVLAEKLVKDEERVYNEHETLRLGIQIGRSQVYQEMAETETEEISEEEFKEILSESEPKEPFGFVGTIDDISLVLGD